MISHSTRVVTDYSSLQSVDELASLYPEPRPSSRAKVHHKLSPAMKDWLRQAPFFVLSSVAEGSVDCSPRGDAPGQSHHILDDNTLAIPDRSGNNRIDTLRNIMIDPRVGLLFLIPGVENALRIKGRARISIEPALLDRFTLNDTRPATVILVTISAVYVQNARAFRAAELWSSAGQVDVRKVPNAAELSAPAT